MHARLVCLGLLLVLGGCGSPEPTPETTPKVFDGTVTFFIASESGSKRPGMLAETTVGFLAVEKPGRTRLVDALEDDAAEGARHARHRFPPGTTVDAVVAYYALVLESAGWKPTTDFKAGDGSIHFFDATFLKAGADRPELQVTFTP